MISADLSVPTQCHRCGALSTHRRCDTCGDIIRSLHNRAKDTGCHKGICDIIKCYDEQQLRGIERPLCYSFKEQDKVFELNEGRTSTRKFTVMGLCEPNNIRLYVHGKFIHSRYACNVIHAIGVNDIEFHIRSPRV